MLYPNTNYEIVYPMNFLIRQSIVKSAVKHMLMTHEEIRFNKDASMWVEDENKTLVLCLYGYSPAKVNINGMTLEDIVEEVLEAFNF